jgi:hypothetical protein
MMRTGFVGNGWPVCAAAIQLNAAPAATMRVRKLECFMGFFRKGAVKKARF